jgi:acid phosphatase type 7
MLGFINFSVDKSAPVGSTSGATPERVRLGLGGGTAMGQANYADPSTSAVFTWETTEQDSNAKVKIGTSTASLTEIHTGYAWTNPGGSPTVPAANLHEVHVCGLTPATTYYYEVGGGAPGKEVWSATQSFTTVPATGKLTVGVLSDARDLVTTWATVHQRMKTIGVNFQVIAGDIVDFGSLESDYVTWLNAIWQSGSGGFLTLGEQLMVPIEGNHEYAITTYAAEFIGNFSIPNTVADGDQAETYASFNAGNAHFVMFDDTPISTPQLASEATAQEAWLEADLAAANANRAKVPFIVVLSHRGVYSTSFHSMDSDVLETRGVLAPIFDKYQVDVVFNGHDHEYERSNLLHAGSPSTGAPMVVQGAVASGSTVTSSKGTTYIINAGAGADPYPVGTSPVAYRATNTPLCVPGSGTTCASGTYIGCYVTLELEGNQITMTAYGITGAATKDTVIDSLTFSH